MTKRYIIAKVDRAVTHPLAHLPAMQPGDSVRVTMRPDGGFDVAPLRPYVRVLREWGYSIRHTDDRAWADAPEQERSDTSEASRENDR